jgi:hypothetical protein
LETPAASLWNGAFDEVLGYENSDLSSRNSDSAASKRMFLASMMNNLNSKKVKEARVRLKWLLNERNLEYLKQKLSGLYRRIDTKGVETAII